VQYSSRVLDERTPQSAWGSSVAGVGATRSSGVACIQEDGTHRGGSSLYPYCETFKSQGPSSETRSGVCDTLRSCLLSYLRFVHASPCTSSASWKTG
jgi:hypothetical protein